MGDTLESILNGMCEIIHRIYAPFIALTMMMDMLCVVYVRGKRPDDLALKIATEKNICVLTTKKALFTCCGILYENGLRGA